ncbi:MAG: AAA family ATPase [Proteobacteria bacterium]|nr:AAA family ATPase [Pseudomonadota bacterium]
MTNPSDIQHEFEKLLKEKYGSNINIISASISPKSLLAKTKNAESDSPHSESNEPQNQAVLQFSKTPKDIKACLDKYVIGQDEAKKTLAIAVCNHYNQIRYYHQLPKEQKADYHYVKQNILMIGPTGVGKTYMIQQIAKMIDVPFVRADATKYSETGYAGGNVEDLVRDLVTKAQDNVAEAEFGIIYIDEADKLAASPSSRYKDISGRGVQLGLLKLLEETEIDLRSSQDPAAQMQTMFDLQGSGKTKPKVINTRHILFILSGSFSNLNEVIKERLAEKAIGFQAASPNRHGSKLDDAKRLIAQLRTEDLIEFGFEPEFIGRLPIRVACHNLSEDDLFQILKTAKGNIISQYKQALAAYDIKTKFHDSALREIARKAFKEQTGARSLATILDASLKDFFYELPSLGTTHLDVDGDLIIHPDKKLKELIDKENNITKPMQQSIESFQKKSFLDHRIQVNIDPDAYPFILSQVNGNVSEVEAFLSSYIKPFIYTIQLLTVRDDIGILSLPLECFQNPQKWFEMSLARYVKA